MYFNNRKRPPMSKEQREIRSASVKKRWAENPEVFNNTRKFFKSYRRSPPSKDMICIICGRTFTTTRNKRKTCSQACLHKDRGQRAGKLRRYGNWAHQGMYKGIRCESTYELAFVVWAFDAQLPLIRCKLQIPYLDEDTPRLYFPDFQIGEQIFEIKGYVDNRAIAKLEAAKGLGINIEMIDNQGIKKYLHYIKEVYGVDIQKEYKRFYENNT